MLKIFNRSSRVESRRWEREDG